MNPTVLIATHARIDITSKNIQSLLRQSVKPKIVLVTTKDQEVLYYREMFKQIQVAKYENSPLGAKWQSGVSHCIDANPLIVTGSDDILGQGFVERACQLIKEGNHFVGLQRFWQHNKGTAYFCEYLAHQPIGGGRIFSNEMLQNIRYKVFDPSKDRHLDDLGWNKVRTSGLKCKWVRNVEEERLHIHAVKGDWICKNPFNPEHKNIKVLRTESSYKVLPEIFKTHLGPDDDLGNFKPR